MVTDKLGGYIGVLRHERRDPRLYCEVLELAHCWRNGKAYATQAPWGS